MFLNIGDLSSQESTHEIYTILALVLSLINSNTEEGESMDEKIGELYSSLRFFNGQFTKLKI
jgi:hypothetical protein